MTVNAAFTPTATVRDSLRCYLSGIYTTNLPQLCHCALRTVQDGFPNGRPASYMSITSGKTLRMDSSSPMKGGSSKGSPTMQSAAFPWEGRRRKIRLLIVSSRNAKNDLELGRPPKKDAFYRQIRRHPGEGPGACTISVRSEPGGL